MTLLMMCGMMFSETETIGDYIWTYRVNDDTAKIYRGDWSAAIDLEPKGVMMKTSSLGGKKSRASGMVRSSIFKSKENAK